MTVVILTSLQASEEAHFPAGAMDVDSFGATGAPAGSLEQYGNTVQTATTADGPFLHSHMCYRKDTMRPVVV